jgi:hypothetical protein
MQRKWAWTSVAITAMWMAVLFTALFAPELESRDVAGNMTKLPVAGIVVAGVAFVATIVVAIQGFRDPRRDVLDDEARAERARLEARIAELEERLQPRDELPRGRSRTLLGR